MKTRIKPYIRPLIVLGGAAGFLALFLNGYLSAGGAGHVWPIVAAVAGVAALSVFLLALMAYAQAMDVRVRRVVQAEDERPRVGAR